MLKTHHGESIVLASNNAGKVREINALLAAEDIHVILLNGGLFASLRKKPNRKTGISSRQAAVPRESRSKKIRRSGGRG